ncbi:MAG: hypothetical protein CW346_05805, partial [Bacillaceae bacterium]|nr:hypothetical protein [Bacillaceae bacterium]
VKPSDAEENENVGHSGRNSEHSFAVLGDETRMPFDEHWIRQSDEVSLSMGSPSASVFPEEAALSLPSPFGFADAF